MKKFSIWFTGLLLTALLGGCGLVAGSIPTPGLPPTFTPVVMPTEIPLPTEEVPLPTLEPLTPTPTPTAIPAQVIMLNGVINMDNYLLRQGPGRLFARVGLYEQGVEITIFGREAGNNWVLVQTGDFRSGWMNVDGLSVTGSITTLPVFRVENAQVLRGHVYLPGRIPAQAIVVSIAPLDKDLSASYDNSDTNEAGEWYLYLPLDITGSWVIEPNAYTCAASNAVTLNPDGSCTLLGNLPPPQIITLPYNQDLAIEFEILPLGN